MSRQLEQHQEETRKKRNAAIVQAVEYELAAAIERSGAVFAGFSCNYNPGEVLLVIKGDLGGRRQVAFVGAENMGSGLIKAVRLAQSDKLKWKDDKWAV